MPRLDASESKLLLVIIIGALLVGLGLAVLGRYLVMLGGSGEATVDLLGQHLSSKSAGIMSIFIATVLMPFLVRLAYKVIMRPPIRHDSLIVLLQTFRRGTGNATENVAPLERIANSDNPNKRKYLIQASQVQNISFMEVKAINLAFTDLDRGMSNLLRRCKEAELPKIQAMIPGNSDPLYKKIVATLKYNRRSSRKDAQSYSRLNDFLSEYLTHCHFTERGLYLSRELESELQGTSMQDQGTSQAVNSQLQHETPGDRVIRLTQTGSSPMQWIQPIRYYWRTKALHRMQSCICTCAL